MKDIYKNPILYYIAVPIIASLWPLLAWAVYLPAAREGIEDQMDQYGDANDIMINILTLDPDRLEFADSNDIVAEFTYGAAVDRVARSCDIPSSKCDLHAATLITTRQQKSQGATVDLKEVDIVRFAKFLSMIQLRWASLQCERVKLTQKQGMPNSDIWDVDIEFKYYY